MTEGIDMTEGIGMTERLDMTELPGIPEVVPCEYKKQLKAFQIQIKILLQNQQVILKKNIFFQGQGQFNLDIQYKTVNLI